MSRNTREMDCESTNKATQQTTMKHDFNNTASKKQFMNDNVSEKFNIDVVPSTSSSTEGKSVKYSTACNTSDKRLKDSSTYVINYSQQTKNKYNRKTNKAHDQTHAQQENIDVIDTGLRQAGGLKNFLHGVNYQLKLPMHYIVRGLMQDNDFQVATEVEEADKFDDLVFLYEDEIALFQAKHKLDNKLKITEDQLLSSEGDFSVPKYFKSYDQILKNKKFQDLIKEKDMILILSTNIGIHDDVKKNFELTSNSSILSGKKILALEKKTESGTEKETKSGTEKETDTGTEKETESKTEKERRSGSEKKTESGIEKETEWGIEKKPESGIEKETDSGTENETESGTEKETESDTENKTESPQYCIIQENSDLYKKLHSKLSTFELHRVPNKRDAEHLATIVLNHEKKMPSFVKLFEEYSEWFLHNVFEVVKEENILEIVDVIFKESFLSESNSIFQETFSKTYLSKKKRGSEETTSLQKHLSGVKFQIPKRFAVTSEIETAESKQNKIKKFLEILVFAMNQPNEDQLEYVIEKEIGEYMGHTGRETIACKFQLYIQNWAKQKEGYFLKKEDIERQFAVWGQENLSQVRMSDVKKYQCTFQESNEVIKNLSNVLKTENDASVLCIYNRETLFSKIKACQFLESFDNENMDQKFIFCDIKDLTELESTKTCPVKAFSSQTCNTLFVSLQDCKLCVAEVKILHSLLEIVIKSDQQRKHLIMAIPEEKKTDFLKEFCFDNYGIKNQSLNDFNNCFNELDEKSRRRLMENGCINFNGKNVISLLSVKDLSCIRDEALLKLITSRLTLNDPFLVTNQYKEVEQYYVNRSLGSVIIDQDITKDTQFRFVRENERNEDIKNEKVIIVSENDDLFEHFRKTNNNVHWLKETNKKYYWMTSQGTLANLRKYVSAKNPDPDDEPEYHIPITNVDNPKNDVVLISASAGMGKSILLSHIAEQSKKDDTSFFVSKTNLADHCKTLDRLNGNNITLKQAIHFVFTATKIESPEIQESEKSAFNLLTVQEDDGSIAFSPNAHFDYLELLRAMVFCNLYNKEKIVLLLDGFDEIAPDYCKSTMRLLQALKRTKVRKMWVTTRPYGITKDLEHGLETFAYTLKPLSKEDQLTFFQKFWAYKGKPSEILPYVKDFINSLNKSTFSAIHRAERKQSPNKRRPNFISMPLHCHMLAKVLTEDFTKFRTQNNDNAPVFTLFTIFDLYSKFFDIKFEEILYKIDILAPQNTPFREIKKTAESDHGKLALLEIFDEKLLTELVPDKDRIKLLNFVKSGKEKTGIVAEVVDNKPQFVHRTFAEYFAALYLAKILLSTEHKNKEAAKSLLYDSITGNSEYYYVLFTFFNYVVVSNSKNKDIFEAAIAGNIKKVLESEKVNEMFDSLNRTPMHLITNNVFNILENFEDTLQSADLTTATTTYNNCRFFCQYLCQSMIKRFSDTLFMWTPIHYFAVCPFERISRKFSILLQYFNDDTQDTFGRTPLMLLILNSSFSAHWIKYSLPFNLPCVNAQDHFQKTALHYAMKNFQEFLIYRIENGLAISTFLNDLEIICFLLRHGARIDIPDNKGITAVDIINSLATTKFQLIFEMILDHERSKLLSKHNKDDIYVTFSHYVMLCLVTRRKCRINVNIERILIIIILRQLLDEYDQPILPVLDSEIFTLLFIIKLSPEIAKHIIETTNLRTLFSNDSHKNIFIFMLTETHTIAQILLSEFPHLVDVVDARGRTALHYAVINKNEHSVTSLIKSNARVQFPDNRGTIPAHINKSDILNPRDELRYHGVSNQIQILNFINSLPREFASQLVLTMNLYPILTKDDANFIVYVLRNKRTIAQVLLSHYPDAVNTKDFEGRTALHYAVLEKDESAIHFLINNNARADIADNDGKYPAHLDKDNQGNQELQDTYDDHNRNMLSFIDTLPFDIAKPLILTMALVPPLTPYDGILLSYVLDEQHTIASVLWAEYSNLVGITTLMENCSYFDCTKVSNEVVCILLEEYCVEDFSHNALKSNDILKLAAELLISVKNNDLSQMQTVLRSVEYSVIKPNLANVNLVNDEVDITLCVVNAKSKDGGKTALHYAAEIDNLEMAQCLLSHGAWYNVPDIHDSTPIHIAKTHASTSVLQLLELVDDLFKSLYSEAYDIARGIVKKKKIDGNLFHCTCFETEESLMDLALETKETHLLQSFIECYHFKADFLDYRDINDFNGESIYSVIDEINLNETELSDAKLNKILDLLKLDTL